MGLLKGLGMLIFVFSILPLFFIEDPLSALIFVIPAIFVGLLFMIVGSSDSRSGDIV